MRLLIVNPFGIGDVLFSTPMIQALRQAFPGEYLAYLCNQRTERVLRHNRHLDAVFVYEKDEMVQLWRRSPLQAARALSSLLRRIRRARFDCVVDLSLGERYAFILKCLGIRRRIGFDYRQRGRFLTERLVIDGYHDTHVVTYYRTLLRFMGVQLLEASLEMPVAPEDEHWAEQWLQQWMTGRRSAAQPLVGMVPAGGVSWGSEAPFRRWSLQGFASVADALIEQCQAKVILFGERTDAALCQSVVRLMRHPVTDLSGQTSLGQFVSLLGRLDLVICNDGGPLHLAVSQGVKTVSIFGPVDHRVYGPYAPSGDRHWVVHQEHLPCRPCYRNFKLPPCPYERACLTTIEPEEILAACRTLLDHGDHHEKNWGQPPISAVSCS